MLVTISISCKKDYPHDIPEWLEKRIKEIKKENPCNENPIQIREYHNNSSKDIAFLFTKPCQFCNYSVYDYNGNLMCDVDEWTGHDSCNNVSFADYDLIRIIWIEKCK